MEDQIYGTYFNKMIEKIPLQLLGVSVWFLIHWVICPLFLPKNLDEKYRGRYLTNLKSDPHAFVASIMALCALTNRDYATYSLEFTISYAIQDTIVLVFCSPQNRVVTNWLILHHVMIFYLFGMAILKPDPSYVTTVLIGQLMEISTLAINYREKLLMEGKVGSREWKVAVKLNVAGYAIFRIIPLLICLYTYGIYAYDFLSLVCILLFYVLNIYSVQSFIKKDILWPQLESKSKTK